MYYNRIIMHHTGGTGIANSVDKRAYHSITQRDGETVKGTHPYSANALGAKLVPGKYAAHTKGLNTGSIGKAVAAMAGGQWADPKACLHFPTAHQMDSFLKDVAKDAKFFGIDVNPRTVLSHAEVEVTLGIKQNNKWDFDYDPYGLYIGRNPVYVGDMLRERIRGYMLDDDIRPIPAPRFQEYRKTLRQGSEGTLVFELQSMLNVHGIVLTMDGKFGPATRSAVVAFQHMRQLVEDGVVGPATWTALEAV